MTGYIILALLIAGLWWGNSRVQGGGDVNSAALFLGMRSRVKDEARAKERQHIEHFLYRQTFPHRRKKERQG